MPDPTATKYAAYLAIHRTAGTSPRSYADWRGEYERARYAAAPLTIGQVPDTGDYARDTHQYLTTVLPERFPVYRKLWLAPGEQPRLDDPGQFWAETPEGASRSGFPPEPGKTQQVILRGEAAREHIDARASIARRRQYGEPEIVLRQPPENVQVHSPERESYAMTAQEVNDAVRDWSPPTEAQIEAGNYQKPTINWNGLRIKIENPRGTKRRPEWKPLAHHYGYIARTEDRDGDAVDCYIGPHLESEIVFVVDQEHPSGRFDEHKVCLAFRNAAEARKGYLDNYQDGWHCGPITAMTIEQFKAWLERGDTTQRVADQVSRYIEPGTPERYTGGMDLDQERQLLSDLQKHGYYVDDRRDASGHVTYSVRLGRVGKSRRHSLSQMAGIVKDSQRQASLKPRIQDLLDRGASIKETAFLKGGKIYPSGPIHLPHHVPGGLTQDVVAGFVTHDGEFLNREEAGMLVDGSKMMTGERLQQINAAETKARSPSAGDAERVSAADGNAKIRVNDQVNRYTADQSPDTTWDAGRNPMHDIALAVAKIFEDAGSAVPARYQQVLDEPERYARKHLKSSAGQQALHFDSAPPTGKHAWTEEDERKHPRAPDGEWAKKGEESKPAPKPQEPDTRLQDHVANLHDAMQEKLEAGKQFLARHAGKPLWIASGDHIRLADDKSTLEHTDPEGRWVRADLAQLDHWADKAGLQPFTGPEGILTSKEAADARDRTPAGKTAPEPTPAPKAEDDRPLDPGGPAGPGGREGLGGSGEPAPVTKPTTEKPDDRMPDRSPELPSGRPEQQQELGSAQTGTTGPDREGESGTGRQGGVGEADPPAGTSEQPDALPETGSGGADVGAEPPATDPGDSDEPPEDEAQPAGPAGVNEPYEPLDPELPEIDDSEPPEEYLAHERPNDLGERIKTGDAAAADEVVRRIDEQYPEDAQGPKADRARAIRKKLVEDFGEKIGGARKDMARPLGKRGGADKPKDDRPGWARRYSIGQIAKSTNKAEEGKWSVSDTKHTNWYGQPRQIGVFDTKEEAEKAIPLAEVARSHSVYAARKPDGTEEYAIVRKVSDRKHPVVRAGFKTRDEAMKYMAQHPEEIIEHQFPRYEQYQYLDHVQREGGKPRTGNSTPADFHQEFGFRGGEFGNWQSGRDGQEALNHAHDALRDLADVLGVEPAGISLGGDLAIAFGARGTGGKDAARAHYEPGARVINLTKMRGAGTLAHEFAHALDNYFARQAKIPGERYGKYEWVTEGLPHRHNLRPEVADAWTNLVKSMMGKEETKAIDPERIQKQKQHHWDHVKTRIDSLETSLAGDKQYNKRHKDLTPEQKAEWDAAKQAILSGQPGDKQFVEGRTRYGGYQTYGNLAKLNQLYKAATGRSFHTATQGNPGQDLYWSIQASLDAEKTLGEAQEGKTETKRRATNYYNAARDLDETRASSYYTIPTEMLARAFEAYVYDKLAAEGRRSDYLVGKAENKYYKMFDMAPFPEGEERQAINAAFDRLFSTMQQRPRSDDKGQHVELYRAEPLRAFAKELYAAYLDRTAIRGP